MSDIQVNTDPTLSDAEFLRSVLRQIEHIAKLTYDQTEFGIDSPTAVTRIIGVIQIANQRPASDDSVVAQLRRENGDLQSRIIDQLILTKQLGAARASLAAATRANQVLAAELDATRERLHAAENARAGTANPDL